MTGLGKQISGFILRVQSQLTLTGDLDITTEPLTMVGAGATITSIDGNASERK